MNTSRQSAGVPRRFTPAQVIALGFLIMIFLGALLLTLPVSSRTGQWTPFPDALFTATSATCVTGLVVYDTFTHWSAFGQGILLVLIQVGGLGFVSVALLINMLRGNRIGLRQRFMMQETTGLPQMAGVLRATGLIFRCTALLEGCGALLLAVRFVPRYGLGRGMWYAVFHSVSAFCNAGFDLMGRDQAFSSMTGWVGDPVINLTLCALIVLGGLGFAAWGDIYEHKWDFRHYRLQTKLVLCTTAVLLAVPALFFLVYELQLPQWAGYSGGEKLLAALFQSVTLRTAGFNTLDFASFTGPSVVVMVVLMLIGGSPGSTAGGIKTTTVAAVFLSVRSTLRHKRDTEVFGRRLADNVLDQAMVLVFLYLTLFLAGGCALCILDGVPLMQALFETASAVGTVGVTMGLTPGLSLPSRMILIFLMYFGRVGGLTMIYAVADPATAAPGRRPQERITIG